MYASFVHLHFYNNILVFIWPCGLTFDQWPTSWTSDPAPRLGLISSLGLITVLQLYLWFIFFAYRPFSLALQPTSHILMAFLFCVECVHLYLNSSFPICYVCCDTATFGWVDFIVVANWCHLKLLLTYNPYNIHSWLSDWSQYLCLSHLFLVDTFFLS